MPKSLLFSVLILWSSIETCYSLDCPSGWEEVSAKCRAKPPSDDYFYPSGSDDVYPVCGGLNSNPNSTSARRIPVLPNFEPRVISTNGPPNSNNSYSNGATTVLKTKSGSDPTYLYDSLTRCVCHAPAVPSAASATSDTTPFTGGNYPGNFARVYPDTYEAISAQDQYATAKYNQVAYSNSLVYDGRRGDVWKGSVPEAMSRCGCPNLNEHLVSNAASFTGSLTGIVGEHCEPKISNLPSQGRVLMTFNSSLHRGANADSVSSVVGNIILDETSEGFTNTSPVNIPSKINVPSLGGGTQVYQRKIWTCAPPYKTVLNGAEASCVLTTAAEHACSETGSDFTTSPVSTSGASMTEKFQNTINKRLACCMNEIHSTAPSFFVKFDCVENSMENYSNFDVLWESKEENLPNAIVLSNALGEYMNGFYTLNGAKCTQYSDFGASSYSNQKLTKGSNGQWTNVPGTRTINPDASLVSIMNGMKHLGVPATASEMARCPILIRFATVMSCPSETQLPSLQRTFTPINGIKRRCSSAASVQVHVRMEQIYEIQGTPIMNPIDTLLENRLVSNISVEKLIFNKNSGSCPGGATFVGDTCVYQ